MSPAFRSRPASLLYAHTALLGLVVCLPACPASMTVETDAGAPADGAADAERAADASADARPSCDVPDRDGDGERGLECGGLDCDDDDPARAPGRPEVCDPADRDEDCDPSTFGIRDGDGDGEPDAACCNQDASGARTCGTDCDDTRASISRAATEACNRVDDDCDGSLDEGVTVALWPDADGDGYGDSGSGSSTPGCPGTTGFSTLDGDCDDAAPARHVGAPEVCNGLDEDCDGTVDDIVDGAVFCASGTTTACTLCGGVAGAAPCGGDCLSWGACRAPAEVCNACDDDGDGSVDEDFVCRLGTSTGCVNACGTAGVAACDASCAAGVCVASEVCNFCDDNANGNIYEERASATIEDPSRPVRGAGTARWAGVATEIADFLPAPFSSTFDLHEQLLDGASVDQAGAYWVELDRYQGWGPTVVHARLRVRSLDGGTPMGGWSVILAQAGVGSDLGSSSANGVPADRRGLRFDWVWSAPDVFPPPVSGDGVRYGLMNGVSTQWRGSLASRTNGLYDIPNDTYDFDAGETAFQTQEVWITYQPEDPSTPAREESVTIRFGDPSSGPAMSWVPDMLVSTTDPNDDLPVGTRLALGFTAGSYTYSVVAPDGTPLTYGARVEAQLYLTRFVPPSGPGDPTWIDSLTISRSRLCPGSF